LNLLGRALFPKTEKPEEALFQKGTKEKCLGISQKKLERTGQVSTLENPLLQKIWKGKDSRP